MRGLLSAMMVLWLTIGCGEQATNDVEPADIEFSGTILAIGDSLTEGYGVEASEAYPALLQKRLAEDGYNYRVVNAGISGETSSGLRSRLDWVLTLNPEIVIVETGANDALRGIDPMLIRENIDTAIKFLKARRIITILAGMRIFRNLGDDYTNAFESIYQDVAEAHDIIFMPFFLKDVAGNPDLNLEDGIHPTAEGYRIILGNIYPYVLKAVKSFEKE